MKGKRLALMVAAVLMGCDQNLGVSESGGAMTITVLGGIAAIAILVWIIAAGVRMGTSDRNPPGSILYARTDGPGRFRVSGVDRKTQMDASDYFEADSPENAKVKAELSGMIVTRVERA